MRYGYYLPTRGPLSEPDAIGEMVGQGEAMGFATIVIADHIVFPTEVIRYLYGGWRFSGSGRRPRAAVADVCGRADDDLAVGHRCNDPAAPPGDDGEDAGDHDVLSKGRVTVGVGVGWLREEFEALHAADFDKRGAVSNEYLEIFKKCGPRTRSLSKVSSILSRNCAAYRTGAKPASADLDWRSQQACLAPRESMRTVGTPWGDPLPHPAAARVRKVDERAEGVDRGGRP